MAWYCSVSETIEVFGSKYFNCISFRIAHRCAKYFCTYDDYNWDWSLQHVSQQCLRNKLHAMVMWTKWLWAPVVHIYLPIYLNYFLLKLGRQRTTGFSHWRMVCTNTNLISISKWNTIFLLNFYSHFSGVHHKKKNCESNQVISKVQQVLRIATKSRQFYPKTLTLTVASVVKKSKLRKGNGGWSDVRDHNLCLNVTWAS